MDHIELCPKVNGCVGWSNTKRRLYLSYPTWLPPNVEGIVIGPIRYNLMAGIPIGGYAQNALVMGTLSFFAQDANGNLYGVTDGHVVYNYNTVYFPSPLLMVNRSYTKENIPLPPQPVPIGEVVWRSPVSTNMDLDLAVFKLYSNVQVYPIAYGKILPLFLFTPEPGETVIKVGARTSLTSGTTVDQSATISITTDLGTQAYFTGSLFAIPSLPGDSGAPIFAGNTLVGTIVGGNGSFAVANNIVKVKQTLNQMGLKILFTSNKAILAVAPIITGLIGGATLALGLT